MLLQSPTQFLAQYVSLQARHATAESHPNSQTTCYLMGQTSGCSLTQHSYTISSILCKQQAYRDSMMLNFNIRSLLTMCQHLQYIITRLTLVHPQLAPTATIPFTYMLIYLFRNYDSSVSEVARLWAGCSKVQFPAVAIDFCAKMSRLTLGPTQLPIQWVLPILCPEIKQPGHEDDHTPSSSANINNVWS